MKPAEKIQYDIEYIKHQSFGIDFEILSKTVKTVLLVIERDEDSEEKFEFCPTAFGIQTAAVLVGRGF